MLLALGLLALAPDGAALTAAVERYHQELYEETAPAVVFLVNERGSGSGFFISADGLILTNAHVVGDAKTIDVVRFDGSKLKGRVVDRGVEGADLALVEVKAWKTPHLPLKGGAPVKVGAFAAAVGHGKGAAWTFNTGMVSNLFVDQKGRKILQTQIPVNPGNSGGPVLDREGRVVGIVTAGIVGANSMNFAIPVELVPRYLAKAPCACVEILAPRGVPIFFDGKMVAKGPSYRALLDGETHEVYAVVKGKMRRKKIRGTQARTITLGTRR